MPDFVIEILSSPSFPGELIEALHKAGFPPLRKPKTSTFVRYWGEGEPSNTHVLAFALRYATERECQENIDALHAKYPGRYRVVEVPSRTEPPLWPLWRPELPEPQDPGEMRILDMVDELDAMLPLAGTHQPGTVTEKRFRDRAKALIAALHGRGVAVEDSWLKRFGLFAGGR
jgi:hypothetical protein